MVIARCKEGLTQREIAEEIGCSVDTVGECLRRVRVPPRRPRPDRVRDTEIVKRYRAGQTIGQVAVATGVSETSVRNALSRSGVKRRPRGPEAGSRRDYDDEVIRRYQAGASMQDVAAAMGLGFKAVRGALLRHGIERRSRGSGRDRTHGG
jgi:DNA-binding CsgD family transcriptional regulator